jgi:DNA-binding MarR family transcriptional regulator
VAGTSATGRENPVAKNTSITAQRRDDALLERYAPRGNECAYANLKLLTRVVTTLYDEALRPVDLCSGQLALLWAILATEPVEIGRLGVTTLTDQTTLSRTVAKLKKARLVSVRAGRDRRVKVVSLTEKGRQRFRDAMPLWEDAQRRAGTLLPLADVRALARQVRKAARAGG